MKKFTASAFMLLICTAALLSTTEGRPGRPKSMYLRCECIKTYSGPEIPTKVIQSLRAIPAGPQCKNEEIIVTTKKVQMCLNPTKDWVISLKEKFNKKSVKRQQ